MSQRSLSWKLVCGDERVVRLRRRWRSGGSDEVRMSWMRKARREPVRKGWWLPRLGYLLHPVLPKRVLASCRKSGRTHENGKMKRMRMDRRVRDGRKCSSRALRSFLNGAKRRKVCKAVCASCGVRGLAAVRVVQTTCMRPLL